MKITMTSAITVFILSLSSVLANPIIGEWSQSVDATIEQWEKNGQFQGGSEERKKEKIRILRTELLSH